MADAVEALGEDVHQEAADELMGKERHGLPAIGPIAPVVLPAKGDATVIGGDQPPVGDGDAMGVTGHVPQDWLWPGERLLGVNDPLDLLERRKEGGEGSSFSEACVMTKELQEVGLMRRYQHFDKPAPEQA